MKDIIKQLGGMKTIVIAIVTVVAVVGIIAFLGSTGGAEHGHTH